MNFKFFVAKTTKIITEINAVYYTNIIKNYWGTIETAVPPSGASLSNKCVVLFTAIFFIVYASGLVFQSALSASAYIVATYFFPLSRKDKSAFNCLAVSSVMAPKNQLLLPLPFLAITM